MKAEASIKHVKPYFKQFFGHRKKSAVIYQIYGKLIVAEAELEPATSGL